MLFRSKYEDTSYYGDLIGSTCWVIAGSVNTTLFAQDKYLTSNYTGARFLIVATSPNGVLVLALDNVNPAVGESYLLDTGQSFVSTGVTQPQVNKYSGDLMYIDNRLAFTPSTEQAVSLLTVITF